MILSPGLSVFNFFHCLSAILSVHVVACMYLHVKPRICTFLFRFQRSAFLGYTDTERENHEKWAKRLWITELIRIWVRISHHLAAESLAKKHPCLTFPSEFCLQRNHPRLILVLLDDHAVVVFHFWICLLMNPYSAAPCFPTVLFPTHSPHHTFMLPLSPCFHSFLFIVCFSLPTLTPAVFTPQTLPPLRSSLTCLDDILTWSSSPLKHLLVLTDNDAVGWQRLMSELLLVRHRFVCSPPQQKVASKAPLDIHKRPNRCPITWVEGHSPQPLGSETGF